MRSASWPSIVSRPSTVMVIDSFWKVIGLRIACVNRAPGSGRAATIRGRSVLGRLSGSSSGITTGSPCWPWRIESVRPSLVPLAVKVAAGDPSENRKPWSMRAPSVSVTSVVSSGCGDPSIASRSPIVSSK